MKIHWKLQQGTEAWHRERYGKIGGSSSKGLFVDSDTLFIDILSQKLEDFEMDEDSYISSDMLRGYEMEPLHRREMSKYAGVEFLEAGWIQSKHPLLGISPDGLTKDAKISAELKCPGRKRHAETLLGGVIPSDHICQCIHYFTVNPKLEKHYFGSFRPESKYPLFVRTLTRDSLVDIGWTKKGKIKEDRGFGLKEYVSSEPDLRTVQDWVNLALDRANILQNKLTESLINLNKI